MSALPDRKQPASSGDGKPEGRVRRLMREMGSPSGQFTGIPPDQWKWMEPAAPHNPPLQRMWSCMIHCTCYWGHESPYAISSDGNELHIENLADMLGLDLANAYRTWRKGARLGLWRNGTAKEGKRRLYLCGKVEPKADDDGEDKANQIVCTDNLPPYLRKVVNGWEAERALAFRSAWRRQEALRAALLANQMAAGRLIADQFDDSFFKSWGLDKIRIVREKFVVDEELVKAAKSHAEVIAPTVYREVALDEAAEKAWGAMSDGERQARIKAAADELTGEYRHGHLKARGWDKTRWAAESEQAARRQLRSELAAVENGEPELSVQTNSDCVQSANDASYGAPASQGTAAHPYSQPSLADPQNSEQSRNTRPARNRAALQPLPPDEHKQLHAPPQHDSFTASDVRTVSDALFHAWGNPLEPEDEAPKKLLEIGLKYVGPKIVADVVAEWLSYIAGARQGTVIESTRYFVTVAEKAMGSWVRANSHHLYHLQREENYRAMEQRDAAVVQLLAAIPAWEKQWSKEFSESTPISFDVPEHLEGVFAVVDQLAGADVLRFCIWADGRFKDLTGRRAMRKSPAGAAGFRGPRLLGVLIELAREFGKNGGGR